MTEPIDVPGQELNALMNYRDTATSAFNPPPLDGLQATADRRRRRTALLGGLAALIIIGAGSTTAVLLAGGDQNEPQPATTATVTPSTSPTSTSPAPSPSLTTASPSSQPSASQPPPTGVAQPIDIPASAMLQPSDLGSGFTEQEQPDDSSIFWGIQLCPNFVLGSYSGPLSYQEGARGQMLAAGRQYVIQRVDFSNAATAAWHMAETRRIVRECASFTANESQYKFEIVDAGFAGDDAVLVKLRYTSPDGVTTERYEAFATMENMRTSISFSYGFSLDQMKSITHLAAQRTCAATNAC